MAPEDNLLAGKLLKVGRDAVVARLGSDRLVLPVGKGMGPRCDDPTPFALRRVDHSAPQPDQLGANLPKGLADRRANLNLRQEEFIRHILADRLLRLQQDSLRTLPKLASLRVDDLVLFLDADREIFNGLAHAIRSLNAVDLRVTRAWDRPERKPL